MYAEGIFSFPIFIFSIGKILDCLTRAMYLCTLYSLDEVTTCRPRLLIQRMERTRHFPRSHPKIDTQGNNGLHAAFPYPRSA